MRTTCYQHGFSLTELSISLVIIALIMGSAISASLTKTDNVKKQQTLAKMDTIEQALAGYVRLRGRLPCPGTNSLAQTHANAGKEFCWGTTAYLATPPAGYSSTNGNTWALSGSVPTKTLNLPDEFALDGWGNRFNYVMIAGFGGNHGTYDAPGTTYRFRDSNMGAITIKDSTLANITDKAVMVLVSHGPNGYGAWTPAGTQKTAPTDATELQNYYTAGVTASMHFVPQEWLPSTLTPYDDIVRYKMKWQLIRDAGAVISDSACTTAETVLNTSDTLISGSYYSSFCGATPGNSNCKNYMIMLANQVSKWCL